MLSLSTHNFSARHKVLIPDVVHSKEEVEHFDRDASQIVDDSWQDRGTWPCLAQLDYRRVTNHQWLALVDQQDRLLRRGQVPHNELKEGLLGFDKLDL